jgi:hypothetical protein
MERWKEVDWLVGYRGVMDVSDKGRVRRRAYRYEFVGRWGETMTATKPDKVLSHYVEKNGYPSVAVQIDGRRKKFSIHRLVGRAFAPGYEEHLTINHINGIKTDNRAENLEWVTLSRNTQLQWETGLANLRGDNNPNRKLSSGKVRIIRRLLSIGATANELSVLLDLSSATLSLISQGKRWADVS